MLFQILTKSSTATLANQKLKVVNMREMSNRSTVFCGNGLSKPMIGRPSFGQTRSPVLLKMFGLAAPQDSGMQKRASAQVGGPTEYP